MFLPAVNFVKYAPAAVAEPDFGSLSLVYAGLCWIPTASQDPIYQFV